MARTSNPSRCKSSAAAFARWLSPTMIGMICYCERPIEMPLSTSLSRKRRLRSLTRRRRSGSSAMTERLASSADEIDGTGAVENIKGRAR